MKTHLFSVIRPSPAEPEWNHISCLISAAQNMQTAVNFQKSSLWWTYLQQLCPRLSASQSSPSCWKRCSWCERSGRLEVTAGSGWQSVCVSVCVCVCAEPLSLAVCAPSAQPLHISAHYPRGERALSVIDAKPTQTLVLSHASSHISLTAVSRSGSSFPQSSVPEFCSRVLIHRTALCCRRAAGWDVTEELLTGWISTEAAAHTDLHFTYYNTHNITYMIQFIIKHSIPLHTVKKEHCYTVFTVKYRQLARISP